MSSALEAWKKRASAATELQKKANEKKPAVTTPQASRQERLDAWKQRAEQARAAYTAPAPVTRQDRMEDGSLMAANTMYGSANRTTSNLMDMATRAKLMQTANEMADIKTRQAKALENPRASTAYTRQAEKQPMQDRAQRVAEIRKDIDTLPEEQSRAGKVFSGVGMNIPTSLMYNVEGVKQGIENKEVFRGTEEAQEYADAVAEFNRIQRTVMEDDPAYIAALDRVLAAEAGMKLANERTDVPVDPNSKAAQYYAANQKKLAEASDGLGPVGSAVAELGVDLGTWGAAALTGPLAPAVLASDVMAGKMYDVQQNGGGASEAAARGAVSAIIEYFAEKMGFDRAAAIFKKPGAANLWDVFLNGVAESGEESVSYGLNFIADKLFGDPNAAFRAEELLKSAGMGFLFGDIVGAGATVANRARLSGIGSQYQDVAPELVAEGLQMKQDTDAYRTAAEMQRKLDAGKTLSNVDVGRVVQDNEAAMAPLRQAAMEMAEAEVKQRAAERTATVSKSLGYGKEGARVFGEIYNGGEVDAKTLLAVFDTPYQAGLTGGDGKKYTDPMQIAAYSAGNSDRIAQHGIDAKAKPGKVFSKAESGFDYTNAPADLTQQQKNFGNLMAKTFGIKGNFVNGETAYNARYVSNVGEVNFAKDFGIDPQMMQKLGDMDFQQKVEQLANKRQQSFAFYVAHEIADHVAANRAPVEMRAFNNAMYNYLRETEGANLARERMAFYGSRGANLDTKGAIEEVAADSILMLYDGDEQKFMTAMERVLNGTDEQAKRGAKTWGEALKSIIEKLKAWAKKLTGRDNAQAKADVEKSVAELERLRDMFEAAIAKAAKNTEQARQTGATKNTTPEGGVNVQLAIKKINGFLYVQADRQVLFGDNPAKWGKQIETFINEQIRKGEDVLFPTADGHILALTERSAYKLSDRHKSQIGKKARTLMSNDEFALKGRIAGHIDELIQVGTFDGYEEDVDSFHENDIGEDGFNYYGAFFKDGGENGGYYYVPFSAGLNSDDETAYSIGTPKKRKFPPRRGSSGNTGAQSGSRKPSININTTKPQRSQEKTPMQLAYEAAMRKRQEEGQFSLKSGDEAATYEENGVQHSLKSLRHDITEGRMFDDLVTAKVFNQKEADLLKQNLDKLVSYMLPNAGILDMNEAYGKENRPYSAYKPNSDPLYVISLDFSTLCRKRLMTQYVIEQLQLRENRPMSAEEQIAIRSMLLDYRRQENALQVACAMCYVEAARLKAPKQMERFFNDTEAIMRKYFAKKDKAFNDKVKATQAKFKRDHGYDENATKKDMSGKDTKALNEMSARMRKEYTPDAKQQAIIDKAKSLPRSTFLTAGNLTALAIDHPDIYAAYTDHIRASTRSKSLESDIPYYYGDSEDMVSDSFIDSVNAENGMRFDSWSDFQMKHMLDMITAVIDLSVRGSKMHGYTKFPEMVRIFGKTGMMFNLSGVTEGNGFDENGALLFSSTEGIDIVEARKLLRDFPETAGLQCIGVSDDHIRALLRADYVDYVIPYHTSGMNATLRKMAGINNWKDYTSTQHARKDPKAKKPADADKWQVEPVWSEFYVPDGEDGFDIMEKTAQRYIDLCHERGLIPKFDQFMGEPGYWKLLVDRKMVNQKTGALVEQKPVKPIFDFDLIKQEIDREVSQYDPQLEKRALKYVVDNFDAVHQRIKDLKKGHPKKPMLKMANELLQAYAEGSKAQYSMKDSEGNALTKEQAEYFKDSKVRDRNGNLKVMYHGTNADFTVFDKGKLSDGLGFFFTEDKREAGDYGTPKPFYLNISNPFDIFGDTPIDNFIGDAPKYVDGHFNYDAAVKGLIDAGYDGILSYSHGTEWYVAFSPEQIKSVANAKPTVDPDIRFSLKGEQQMAKELKRIREEGKKAGKTAEQIRTEVARIVGPEYAELLKTYGAIERGETPFRDIQVPERTGKTRKVSQAVRSILEAKATPDAMIPDVEALVAEGALSFESYTDDQAIADATAKLQTRGWSNTLSKWIFDVDKGVVTKENTVTGWALYNNAANKGDVETALTILQKMVGHQRNAAQALQATRVLKKLSPDAQLYGVQRSVQDLQDELNKKYGDDKAPQLKIDPELGEKFMRAETDAERDEVMGEIYRDVGKQMPSTFRDKWNAWRYLAMLGNARTHVRNIVGNAGFAPVVGIKNVTATGIEALVSGVSGGKIGRTKAITADKAMLKAAWEDYANVADEISNGGKYSDFQNANKKIEAGRVIFKNKALEKARTFNSAAMEKEDTWFSKPHYAAALASYCKANGITAQQIAKGGKAMDKARAYAIKEAQKATYRDTNALSQAFGEIGGKWRTDKQNGLKRAIGIGIEGVLPFRKTPANILARGVEYSPIGLMNGIKKAVWDVQKGNATAAEAIDNISAGLTGTMLMALGAFLAAQGLIRGGGEGDDKEKEFAELQGHQTYAMELPNGKSVTLDWLAPEALPFFIGVNFFESTQGKKEEMDIDSIIGSVTSITEPLLEMSCLQGLNDLIDSVGYASGRDVNSLVAMAASAATSYLTQALPTLGGQIERTFERERMTTYSDKNKRWIPADLQYTIGKATAKIPIPGLDYQQIPYIDAWGRTESTGNFAENAFGNLLNPSYTSQIDTTAMEDELLRLYRSTGESVFPSRAARYFMVNNERKDLTKEEYVQYATLKGRYSYELLTELVDSSTYKSLTDAEKAKMVREVFDNANKQAKAAISEYELDDWAAKYAEAEKKYGINQEVFAEVRMNTRFLASLKDKDGETITNSLSLLKMEAVYNISGLTDKQRQALFDYLDVGKSVRHYNKSLVKQKLAAMRKNAK